MRSSPPKHAPLDFALVYFYNTVMTESPDAETPPAPALSTLPGVPLEAGRGEILTPLAPGYRSVIRIQMILTALPLLVGAGVLALVLDDWPWRGPAVGALAGLLLAGILLLPSRRFARWGYQLDGDRLRVVRGYWFHVDTIVPFVRVQHIDVSQGPVERLCGVSTLTVHTAGTHNSVVDLPGLEPDRAAAMRDAIRDRIRSDNE